MLKSFFFSFFSWFDGAMAAAGQIWVEGQCDNKDKRMCFPEVPFFIQKKKRETVQDIIMCSTSKISFVTFFIYLFFIKMYISYISFN